MKTTTLLTLLLLVVGSRVDAQVSIGVSIGAPPPPLLIVAPSPYPGPDFVWIEGYWYPVKHQYKWHRGYWTRPPYERARWVAPRHNGERFHGGYWDGDHGRFEHEHRWDRDRDRDFHRHGHR